MTGGIFGERGTLALEKGLWALSLRQRVIADNLANASTPGFKRGDVSFARELAAYLDTATGPVPGPSPSFLPSFYRETGTSSRLDGNNVDVEREMASLLETALLYEAAVRQLAGKLRILQMAASEGRR